MYRIVFFDVDGTLLQKDKTMPESTKHAIQMLKQKNIDIVLASGRGPFSLRHLAKDLGIDSYISLNGSYVVYQGTVIYQKGLDKDFLSSFNTLSLKNDHTLHFITHERICSNREDPDAEIYLQRFGRSVIACDPEVFLMEEVYQTIVFADEPTQRDYETQFLSRFPVKFYRWTEHPIAFDVVSVHNSKASGINALIRAAGIDIKETVAFGDGRNDVEMLSHVAMGIAMGNAPDAVKKTAARVTKPVHKDGIYHGLREIGLI